MQEIKFNKIDGQELSTFVKKLLPIDKFIFMKIAPESTMSSVYLPERDAVKLVKQSTSEKQNVDLEPFNKEPRLNRDLGDPVVFGGEDPSVSEKRNHVRNVSISHVT